MPLESAPYWFARCDRCQKRAQYGDISAFEEPDHATEMATASEWTEKDGVWHCPDCPPLDVDEDEPDTAASAGSPV